MGVGGKGSMWVSNWFKQIFPIFLTWLFCNVKGSLKFLITVVDPPPRLTHCYYPHYTCVGYDGVNFIIWPKQGPIISPLCKNLCNLIAENYWVDVCVCWKKCVNLFMFKSKTKFFKVNIRTWECINISILVWQHVSILLDHLQASIQLCFDGNLYTFCFTFEFKHKEIASNK
jgi:hypothetical protein